MFEWLGNNASTITALGSLLTVVIWVLYLNLFYREYRTRGVPHIVIKQGYGFDLDTSCYISNMGHYAVDVIAALIRAQRAGESVVFVASEMSERAPDHRRAERPLQAGNVLELATFRSLVRQAEEQLPPTSADADDDHMELEVRVVALVGPQQVPRGARRRFHVFPDEGTRHVQPHDVLPQQLSSRRQRRLVRQWLEQAQELKSAGMRNSDAPFEQA